MERYTIRKRIKIVKIYKIFFIKSSQNALFPEIAKRDGRHDRAI